MPSGEPWSKHPLIYEINTRVWLTELSAKRGHQITLDKMPDDEIERIARHGFHAVWLMGVWTTGDEPVAIARTHPGLQKEYRQALENFTAEDVIGSPYAISKYAVSPTLGGPEGLAAFRKKLAASGLRLILDFVSNHTAKDHWLVRQHPDVFISGTESDLARDPTSFFRTPDGAILAHGRDPYFPAWTDTAQINYAQLAGREAMKVKLRFLATQCDGLRCDMAMLTLPEIIEKIWGGRLGPNPIKESFWKEAIQDILRVHPNFLFLGESYWNLEWKLQQNGFHFTYDKTLYDRLRQADHRGTRQHLQAEVKFQERCARFVENHDEPRAAAAFGPARARSAASVTFFTPGLKLFHEGQLEGRRVKIPVQLGRRPVETADLETAIFYSEILSALRDQIFQTGVFSQCEAHPAGGNDFSNEALVALLWTPAVLNNGSQNTGYLIIVNLNHSRAYGRIPLPSGSIAAEKQYFLLDHLGGKRYDREGAELQSPGLYVALEGHQTHLFEIRKK